MSPDPVSTFPSPLAWAEAENTLLLHTTSCNPERHIIFIANEKHTCRYRVRMAIQHCQLACGTDFLIISFPLQPLSGLPPKNCYWKVGEQRDCRGDMPTSATLDLILHLQYIRKINSILNSLQHCSPSPTKKVVWKKYTQQLIGMLLPCIIFFCSHMSSKLTHVQAVIILFVGIGEWEDMAHL